MSDVAVVVLNYNGRSFLADCLAGLTQSTVPVDVFVADNGSTDGSLDYLRQHFPAVRLVDLKQNWGFAEGYNRAVARIEHPWLVLLNNDATLAPDWVERLLTAAARRPRAVVLGGKLLFSERPGEQRVIQSVGARFTNAGTAFEIGWGEPDRGQYDEPAPTASIPGAALLIKRAVFAELGGFDGSYFAYLEDVDLCWRAWLAGYEVWCDPAAVAFHRFGGTSGGRASPRRICWMQRNRFATMLKNLELASLPGGAVVSVAYDLYRLLEYTLHGQTAALGALAAGALAFLRDLRPILARRAAIQRARHRRDADLRQMGLLVSALDAYREYRRLGKLAMSRETA